MNITCDSRLLSHYRLCVSVFFKIVEFQVTKVSPRKKYKNGMPLELREKFISNALSVTTNKGLRSLCVDPTDLGGRI